MRGDTRFETLFGGGRIALFACICVCLLVSGCSEAEQPGTAFDASRLPRVSGAKEVFASQATTIFTSPNSVAETADALEKALAAGDRKSVV